MMDAFVISIVAYTVSFSMTKIFGKKHDYPVDATQELYALVCYYDTKYDIFVYSINFHLIDF